MVALESPGADITENTDSFAVFMPNENIADNPWQNYKITINELEDITGYDFLDNLPDELKEILENKNTLIPDANLLATFNIEPDSIVSSNSSIGHNGISEKSSTEISNIYNRIGKIGVNNIGSYQSRSRQISTSQIGSSETGIRQFGISQVSSSQINIFQSTDINTSLAQIGAAKVNSNNIYTLHESSAKIDPFKNSNAQFLPISQVRPREITFSSSISPKQFFNSHLHNSKPQIINELNNSATNIWSDLLQSDTQIDIDFQITDLPSGQLAEATITGFDASGVPNAGTILIDRDATVSVGSLTKHHQTIQNSPPKIQTVTYLLLRNQKQMAKMMVLLPLNQSKLPPNLPMVQ